VTDGVAVGIKTEAGVADEKESMVGVAAGKAGP
jgi:hypothetical protein